MSMRTIGTYAVLWCGAMMLASGCGTTRVTDTPRTATEQLLVSAAVEQAASQLDFEFLEDRKVFLDDSLVERVDKTFVIGAVRAAARQAGVILVDQRNDAHYVLELRAGAVGVDRNEYLLGIPSAQIPTLSGPVGVPEIATYKSITQTGGCSMAFVAYSRDDGRFFYSSGPVYGFSDHRSRWFMGAGPGTRDNIAPPRKPANTAGTRRQPASPDERAAKPE